MRMRLNPTILTFVCALIALASAGTGLVLLLVPSPVPAVHARPVETDSHEDEIAGTPSPAPPAPVAAVAPPPTDEFPLMADRSAIPRPEHPNRIVISSIALDARVTDVGVIAKDGKPVWDTAAFAVGFHHGSALPGTRGNTVMAGHISSPISKKGDIFRRLPEVHIGDRVDVFAGTKRFTYQVAEIRLVPPTAVQVLDPTPDATLTLITCYPDQVYSHRLVVVGKLLDPA